MKIFFVLLILAACGKTTTPPMEDLYDSDGDGKINALESDLGKYVADIESFGEVNGVLSFRPDHGLGQVTEVRFSNTIDLKKEIIELLTRHPDKIGLNHHDEWSKLRMERWIESIPLKQKHYEVRLQFSPSEKSPAALYFNKAKDRLKIDAWKKSMTFSMDAEDLRSVLKGTSHFSLTSAWAENSYFNRGSQFEELLNKNYRVFYFNGHEAQVLYVSKELSFKRLMKLLKVDEAVDAGAIEPFSMLGETQSVQWWAREISAQEKVIAFALPEDITIAYRESLKKLSGTLARINGKAQNLFKLSKAMESKTYLILRGQSVQRSFKESSERRSYREGGGGGVHGGGGSIYWSCSLYRRDIANETSHEVDLNWLRESLELKLDGRTIDLNTAQFIHEGNDEEGKYWALGFNQSGENWEIRPRNNSADTYLKVGVHSWRCDGSTRPQGTFNVVESNFEGKMELKLETYVEKL